LNVLAQAGLPKSSLYRSSYSGGWHLYLFFDEPLNSADLRRQLIRLLTLNDFEIGKGQLEIFPNPGSERSLGLGLRLPLQPGFAWLDKETLEVEYNRSELSPTQALELFVDALDGDANSFKAFRELKTYLDKLEARKTAIVAGNGETNSNVIPLHRPSGNLKLGEFGDFVRGVFGDLPPGIIVDNWYKGRIYHLSGLTGPSQRAEAIECLGHYLFYGDPSRGLPALGYGYEQERQWAIEALLERRNNGQSKDINRQRPDAFSQIERAVNWRPQHKKNAEPQKYSAERPISWIRENANRKSGARKRITEALDGLKKRRRSFTTVELQEAAGCSRRTLYDHADIWRKDYEDLAAGFFAICTDEYNAVVGADSPGIQPPTTVQDQIAPPGLLAARRIAFEIDSRRQREKRKEHKAAVVAADAAEKQWLDKVKDLTSEAPSKLAIERIKLLIAVLAGYLPLAPCEEMALPVQKYLVELRAELIARTVGLGGVGPPAPETS
jgi:hypothetical protein